MWNGSRTILSSDGFELKFPQPSQAELKGSWVQPGLGISIGELKPSWQYVQGAKAISGKKFKLIFIVFILLVLKQTISQ